MKSFTFAALAVAVMLTGCAGGSPPSVRSVPAVATQGRSSWISPAAAGKNLLYVSNYSSVLVFVYGTSTQVGSLNYFTKASGSCTDSFGDVFVANYNAADVLEFAHAKTAPINTFIDPSPYPIDCTVDPSTGNLAVVNQYGQAQYSPGDVAVYTSPKAKPKVYKVKGISDLLSGSYDAAGNLLAGGYESSQLKFAILQRGSSAFKAVTLPHSAQWKYPGYIRWDGQYFVVEFGVPYYQYPSVFMWYTVRGTKATQQGYTLTLGTGETGAPFWLGRIGGPKSVTRANQLVAATTQYGVLGWNYPIGGAYIFAVYPSDETGGVSASPRV